MMYAIRPTRRRSFARRIGLVGEYGIGFTGVMLIVLGVVVGTIAIASSRAVGRITCRNFATQTGFPTKFAILNFFDTGTCLAKAPNGRWVLNTQIVQFTGKTKP